MPKTKKDESSSESDSGPDDRYPPAKKSKETPGDNVKSKNSKSSGEGKNQWVLEKLKLVKISEFRGRKLIDIREHYEKNGEMLPGKKGISLSIEQWKKLLNIADEINQAVGSD